MRKWIVCLISVLGISMAPLLPAADFNADGTDDVAIFRGSTGLWAIRGLTRIYFGTGEDSPQPADYDGDGTADIAIFRARTGLWVARGITRTYFGTSADIPVPGDYNGDGSAAPGVFRDSNGLWAIRGVTRLYYGRNGDLPAAPADTSTRVRVTYIAIPGMGGAAPAHGTYVDWNGATATFSDVESTWSVSFATRPDSRLYLNVLVPNAPNTYARLLVNDVRLLNIETQDEAGFDGYLRRDSFTGDYYFEGVTWDE